jgi:hypothetical protein
LSWFEGGTPNKGFGNGGMEDGKPKVFQVDFELSNGLTGVMVTNKLKGLRI